MILRVILYLALAKRPRAMENININRVTGKIEKYYSLKNVKLIYEILNAIFDQFSIIIKLRSL